MANPEIRFKKDDGTEYLDWEETTLGEICTGFDYGMNAAAGPFDGQHKYIRITDIDDETRLFKQDEITSPKGAIDSKYRVTDGTLLFARTGASVGKSYLYKHEDGELYFAGFLIRAIVKKGISPYCVFTQTLTRNYRKWVALTSMRTGQPGINAQEYSDYDFSFPTSPEEQQKIAALFTEVDNLISAASDEVSALEEAKKGMMQKIFSQEVRFKRNDGTEYPDWEELTLGDIVEPNNIPVDNPGSHYVKLAIRSHCKGTFHKPINSEDEGLDVDKMYLVEPENLIVNITFAWEHAIAITKPEDAGTYVSHRFPQYKFVNGNLPAFYEYVIKNPRMKYEMGLCSPGGAGRNRVLNQKDFLLIPMIHPSVEEQQKIADFLSSMDDAIAAAKDELAGYQELKKGLLQKMFA